jgi:hypothetical protein
MSAPTRILFIGNSYTQRNDLPGILARLAEKAGHPIETDRVIASGTALKAHWNKGDAGTKIREGGWSHVVLQERSDLPWKSPARMRESILLFHPVIRESGAETVLYLSWSKLGEPEHQAEISASYRGAGEEIGAVVAPAGEAWARVLETRPEITLHDADRSHPTLAGTYLAACVFYAALFGKSPVGLETEVEGLDEATVKFLQETAWEMKG